MGPAAMTARPALEALPFWPETVDRAAALAFTGLAESLFDKLESAGTIASRSYGPRGARIYRVEQLRKVVNDLFGKPANDIDSEFDGIAS